MYETSSRKNCKLTVTLEVVHEKLAGDKTFKASVCQIHDKLKQLLSIHTLANTNQIFHAFLFSIRNYSPEVINIQPCEAELNIILLRVNNFDIKPKNGMEYLFYYMPQTPNKIWEDPDIIIIGVTGVQ